MSMPKFGNLTSPMEDVLREIRTIGEMGFDFVEIGIEGPTGMPEILLKKRAKILELLKDYGMFALGHTSWWFEFGSCYENVRRAWILEAKRTITTAKKLGIEKLNFHSHSRGKFLVLPGWRKKTLNNFVKSMKELVLFGKKNNVEIMLENDSEHNAISRFMDFRYIIDRVPGLKTHLDIGHINVAEGNRAMGKWLRYFSKKLVHLHFHDNHGESDEHLAIGKGNIDYKNVVKILKSMGYDKTITFEVFAKNRRGLISSRERIKRMWK